MNHAAALDLLGPQGGRRHGVDDVVAAGLRLHVVGLVQSFLAARRAAPPTGRRTPRRGQGLPPGRHLLVVQLRRERHGPRPVRARSVVDQRVIFMVASTNLVIELGVVLYLLLGMAVRRGANRRRRVMIVALFLLTHFFFSRSRQEALRQRVLEDSPPPSSSSSQSWRQRFKRATNYRTRGALHARRHHDAAQGTARRIRRGRLHHRARPTSWWSHLFFRDTGR
jgi:hypothetical protein